MTTSFIVKAETKISWKQLNGNPYEQKIYLNGAFFVPLNEFLLISTGINNEFPLFIAESLTKQMSEAQPQEILVLKTSTKNSVIQFQQKKAKHKVYKN